MSPLQDIYSCYIPICRHSNGPWDDVCRKVHVHALLFKAQTSKPTSSLSLNIYIYNRTTWLNMTSEILLQSIYLNSQSRWKKKKEKLGVWKFVLAQGLLSHVRLCKLFLYKLWLAKKVTETIVSVSVSLPSCLLSASTLLLQ